MVIVAFAVIGILTAQFIFQLTFEGIIGTGTQGDISLDDVSVSDKCNGMLWRSRDLNQLLKSLQF